jgi:hypothetical protein
MYKATCASQILQDGMERAGVLHLLPQYRQVVRARSNAGQDGEILEENKQGHHKSKVVLEALYPEVWLQISYRPE